MFSPSRQGSVAVAAGAVSMAVLACTVSLGRNTTAHDWYAACKLTLTELLIAVGFDGDAPVDFRNADGVVETVSRYDLTFTLSARWAREDILAAAREGATLGALSGFGGALLCFALLWRSMEDRRRWRPANEPAAERRREMRERPVTAQERLAPTNRLTISEPARPSKEEPVIIRQRRSGNGKDDKAAPPRREPRKRDYGRWV